MHIEALFEGEGFRQIQELLAVHRHLLNDIKPIASSLVGNHEEIFRRDPTSRLKGIRSIHMNVDKPGMSLSAFIDAAAALPDIAGIRLTIATKDQLPQTDSLLHRYFSGLGQLRARLRTDGVTIRGDGYAAKHWVLTSSLYAGAKCEIQIRTLTQDLWAVFSHYESYKRHSPNRSDATEELVNYAKLMDVADDFARLIRRRKIKEAEEHHRNACADAHVLESGADGVLTIDVLDQLVNSEWPQLLPPEVRAGTVSTQRLCDLLYEVAKYSLYTSSQMRALLNASLYVRYIVDQMSSLRIAHGSSADVFYILCTCHRVNASEIMRNELGAQMKGVVDGYLRALTLEKEADMQMFDPPDQHLPAD